MIVKAVVRRRMRGGGGMASERMGEKERGVDPQKQLNRYKYLSKLQPVGIGIRFLKQDWLNVLSY